MQSRVKSQLDRIQAVRQACAGWGRVELVRVGSGRVGSGGVGLQVRLGWSSVVMLGFVDLGSGLG